MPPAKVSAPEAVRQAEAALLLQRVPINLVLMIQKQVISAKARIVCLCLPVRRFLYIKFLAKR